MSDEVKDEEIQIGKSKVGLSSVIKLNVKTLIMIIGILYGGLSTVATIGYFNLQSEIVLVKEDTKSKMESAEKNVETELNESLHILRDDIKGLIKEQGDLKGDIKVLLEKTRQINTTIESSIERPDAQHLPTLGSD
jgi:hypothetical protein